MRANVIILTGNHLCHNPRVIKEAITLERAGYNVGVLGGWFDPLLKLRDQEMMRSLAFSFIPVIDSTERMTSSLGPRLRSKLGSIAFRLAHIENRWQLGQAYAALHRAAFGLKADLYIAHSEAAMSVGVDLLRCGRQVGLDMEDWFSEDLLPDARRHRPLDLLRSLEKKLLVCGAYASCPSGAMSEALAQQYRCAHPRVIYNAFQWTDRRLLAGTLKDRNSRRIPSIHWFSQTLGAGRGLEDLITALPLLRYATEIHLRGNPAKGFESWLWNRVPESWRNQIFIHGLVSNEELLSRIAEHDIGFAGEMDFCRSRDLTVTNKILYYILAGLAVVASNTTGQQEVAEQARGAVLLYPFGDVETLAARLNELLSSTKNLDQAKANALRAAERTFCWERQEVTLLEAVTRALGEKATSGQMQ